VLNITTKNENDVKNIFLSGELDTLTSEELEQQMDGLLSDAKDVIVDLKDLEYITSAGLRILLEMQNIMSTKGSMKITNSSEVILEIFEVTGFTEVLTIV